MIAINIKLIRADVKDAELIWKMQVEAFAEMYEKYQDTQTSPAAEAPDRVTERLRQPFTYYYFIEADGIIVGAIRVIDTKEENTPKRISPIFVLPPYRRKGIAQKAILEAEKIHGSNNWELETVSQEVGICRLYEKMGYHKTGKTLAINDKMTLVFYKKD